MEARARLLKRWYRKLDSDQDLVWRTTLRSFADLGRAPRIADLVARTGLAVDRLRALLGQLEAHDLIGLDHDAQQVRLAYPFTQAATEHRVECNGHTLHALCAIDALGVGAMYNADTAIQTRCRCCGAAIRVTTIAEGRTLGIVEPVDAVVWYDFAYERSAAASCCPSIVFLCTDEHLQQWLRAQTGRRAGIRLAMDEALEVGRALFGPILTEAA
jgi:alkylmercury lyase